MIPSSTNGDGEGPNLRHISRNTTVSSISRSLILENLIASWSSLSILICRKHSFKSSVIATGLKQHRVSPFQSMFCNTRPTLKHSLKDGLTSVGLADTSYTTQSLVVSADCFTTGLCWM